MRTPDRGRRRLSAERVALIALDLPITAGTSARRK